MRRFISLPVAPFAIDILTGAAAESYSGAAGHILALRPDTEPGQAPDFTSDSARPPPPASPPAQAGPAPADTGWRQDDTSTRDTIAESAGQSSGVSGPDHFEFFFDPGAGAAGAPAAVGHGAGMSGWSATTALINGDGRPDDPPDPTPQDDGDPDPPPPPIDPPIPPEPPEGNGRPPGDTPGDPVDSPTLPPDVSGNAASGRDPDAMPDLPPDTGPLASYTSGGPAADSFNITVEFLGSWSVDLQDAFIVATEYLSAVILADLPEQVVDGVLVDDLNITATLTGIDGTGGTLGSAGPREIRDVSYLPATGAMTFDSADAGNMLDQGRWLSLVLHEIMHTLGFGSHLGLMGLTSGSVAGGDIRFIGANAIAYYNSEFPAIAGADPDSWLGVPLETDGGGGTAGSHWDEALFDAELMTGYNDASNYISPMTIAALEDMGYDTVIDDPADPGDLFGVLPPDPLLDIIA